MLPSRRALVVALGNPLTVEDSFGPRVLESIRSAPAPPDVDLLDAHTDLLGHIDRFPSYPLVILIDALLDPSSPQAISVVDESTLLSFPDDAPSIHQMSPVTALKLFRQLHPDAPTRIVLVAYRVHEMGFLGALDEAIVAQAAREVLRLLE